LGLVRVPPFLKQLRNGIYINYFPVLPPAPQSSTIFNISLVSEFYCEATVEFEANSFISIIIAPCNLSVILPSGSKKKFFINVKSFIKIHSSNLPSKFHKLIGLSYLLYHILCLQSILSLLQLHRKQLRNTFFLHSNTINSISRFHGTFSVSYD